MEKNVDTLEKSLSGLIDQVMELPENSITEENIDILKSMFSGMFTPQITKKLVDEMMEGFEAEAFTRAQAEEFASTLKVSFAELIEATAPSKNRAVILTTIFDSVCDIVNKAVDQYHNYAIELPIKIGENGHIPTYAHETDAAADIYAAETITIPARSISNMVKTEMRFALPEGWVAHIAPRSSIGANTPLRLSNELGVIDSSYRGEVKIIFDNISDSNYIINKGDRIAQMWIEPVYRFKPQLVDILTATDRGEGGFGSTGK